MTVEEAIQVAIAKATAAESDSAYYERAKGIAEYGTDIGLTRFINGAKAGADLAVAYHQQIKVGLVALLS